MTAVISLKSIVDSLEITSQNIRIYLNKNSGETRDILEDELYALDMDEDEKELPDWQAVARQETEEVLDSKDWIQLPDSFTIHEYQIMKAFCYSVESERLQNELLDSIHGSGAFRRFKSTIYRRGLEEDWFVFKRKALKDIATMWLEENGLEYVRDEGHDQG